MRRFLHGAPVEVEDPEPLVGKLPSYWTKSIQSEQGWELVVLNQGSDEAVLHLLEEMLRPSNSSHLGHGRDCSAWPAYSRLKLQLAWRYQHPGLRRKYDTELQNLMQLRKRLKQFPEVHIPVGFRESSSKLPGGVRSDVREVFLLHGTKSESLLNILSDGLNERYSGGLFGHGTYLAEDSAKCDQYTTADKQYSSSSDLHRQLYTKGTKHPGNVFYILVCRVLMGWHVRTKDGQTSLDHEHLSIWSTSDKRELSSIPGKKPPVTFHSLLVETGGKVSRFREVILTHSERIYPEYLMAYSRA